MGQRLALCCGADLTSRVAYFSANMSRKTKITADQRAIRIFE